MTDIVERLRELADGANAHPIGELWNGLDEAADEIIRLRSRITELEQENARLIEDRCRFPDRPDDIGRMIGAHIGNLKAAKSSSDKYAAKYRDERDAAQRRIAELEALLLKERNDKADAIHNAAMANIELEMQRVPEGCALIPLTERMPDPDKHPRVVVYTEGYDFQGEQFFDVDAESLNENRYADPADQPEVCRYATHWIGADELAARAQIGAVPVCEPRKKKPGETPTETLCRRLEEYIEYASNTKRFADVGFYQELIEALTATGGTE